MSDFFDNLPPDDHEIELSENLIEKGDIVRFNEIDATITSITLGLGWDLNVYENVVIDLDVSLFLLNREEMTREDEDFVFYNNPQDKDGSVLHTGDNRTGAGDGDDETIEINLNGVSFDIVKIPIVLTIDQGIEKEQNLAMVRNTYIRVVNKDTEMEILRYKLDEDLVDRTETGMVVGVLMREGPNWSFHAQTEMLPEGLPEIATRYGIIVKELQT